MKKIFYVMGKSASGKDTIYKKILEQMPRLSTVTLYTTRPMRDGEKDGVEYYFTDEKHLEQLRTAGKVIESRTYETVCGPWTYATVDDGQFERAGGGCLMIGTLESFEKLKTYFGESRIVPIYVEVEDGLRLLRAVERERKQKNPKYAEVCRRFLADEADFSEENLKKCGIARRYENEDLDVCMEQILTDIRKSL